MVALVRALVLCLIVTLVSAGLLCFLLLLKCALSCLLFECYVVVRTALFGVSL